ncbi:hypothetical protein DFH09DRAFT_1096032 [Mycena vulgaris]|nr:hypothetical protein DFH09DRAFT_1096032 [Mycena vulgaris]
MAIVLPTNNTSMTLMHAPPLPPLAPDDFPDVRYWSIKKWRAHVSSTGEHVSFKTPKASRNNEDSDENDSSDEEDNKPNVLGFLEHKNGKCYSKSELDHVRQTCRQQFSTFLAQGIAPQHWPDATVDVHTQFRRRMLEEVPDLRFCENNWKVDTVGTEVYAQWSRYRKQDLPKKEAPPEKKRKHKVDPNRTNKRLKVDKETPKSPLSQPHSTAVPSPPNMSSLISIPAWTDENNASNTAPNSSHTIASDSSQHLSLLLLRESLHDSPPSLTNQPVTLSVATQPAIIMSEPTPVSKGRFVWINTVPSARLAAVTADEASVDSGTSAASATSGSNDPSPPVKGVRSTKHVPGVADTAWNLFGRKYCAEGKKINKSYTTVEVKTQWHTLSPAEKKRYTDEANELKTAAKAKKSSS